MEKILIIALIFISTLSFGQISDHKLDSILFVKINEYRISKGVKALIWDSASYEATKHHSLYLFKINTDIEKTICTHTQRLDVGIKILETPKDRYMYFGGKSVNSVGECAAGGVVVYVLDLHEEMSIEILDQWKKSPPHNLGLLDSTSEFGSVASSLREVGNFRNRKGYMSYSTFIYGGKTIVIKM